MVTTFGNMLTRERMYGCQCLKMQKVKVLCVCTIVYMYKCAYLVLTVRCKIYVCMYMRRCIHACVCLSECVAIRCIKIYTCMYVCAYVHWLRVMHATW